MDKQKKIDSHPFLHNHCSKLFILCAISTYLTSNVWQLPLPRNC
ncbi:hypothetical protein MGE_04342, partial [Candida albicans P75010]